MATTRRAWRVAAFLGLGAIVLLAAAAWLGREHVRFRILFEPLGPSVQGYLEYRHRKTGLVFVRIPGGRFLMGDDGDAGPAHGGSPRHEVTLSTFLIAKHEVTQDEWTRVMSASKDPRASRGFVSGFEGGSLPAHFIGPWDCQLFCALSGLSLPSEAQWERACTGGRERPFDEDEIRDMAWFGATTFEKLHPVGEKAPNGYGLHDMLGNVWEHCADVYDPEFYSRPEAAGPDPVCRSGSEETVVRGGMIVGRRGCTCTWRDGVLAEELGFIGLRPAWGPVP